MLRFNAFVALLLFAQIATAAPPVPARELALWGSSGFLSAHPEVKHRKMGLWHMERGDPERAVPEFLKAARFSDKGSQAMLAEMYWLGEHVGQDRARAYAWMDLAAERGYTLFVGKREHYWKELTPAERSRALEVGAELYATYGDDVAKPRLEHVLVRELRKTTGSNLGALGPLVVVPQLDTMGSKTGKNAGLFGFSFGGDTYYNRKYWVPERYFEWTDTVWKDMPEGEVDVGEPRATD